MLSKRLGAICTKDSLVLAIPRGGVVIGCKVAGFFGADLDIITPRKMGAPGDEELAIGAVVHDDTRFLNRNMILSNGVSTQYIKDEASRQAAESRRRLEAYRGGRPYPRIQGRSVVLVDDGIATGATAIAALRWIRANHPSTTIVAAPVIPHELIPVLRGESDGVESILSPQIMYSIGRFYRDFKQFGDLEVMRLLRGYWTGHDVGEATRHLS